MMSARSLKPGDACEVLVIVAGCASGYGMIEKRWTRGYEFVGLYTYSCVGERARVRLIGGMYEGILVNHAIEDVRAAQ